MKKIFLVSLFITFLCPFLFAEVEYILPNENLKKEINSFINQFVQDEHNLTFPTDPSANANYNSVFHIVFTRNSLIESNNKQETVTNKSGCVAVALSNTWLLASGHCFWDQTIQADDLNELANIDRILDVKYTDFSVVVKNKHIKAVAYKLTNLYLLHLVNNDKLEDNTSFPYLLVSSNKDKAKLLNSFKEGLLIINRTMHNEDLFGVVNNNFLRSNYDPYFSRRDLFPRHIKDISIDYGTNIKTAIINGLIKHKAGDPMFYIEHYKEYLLGFGDALNIQDNTFHDDITRTHKITLLSLSDLNEIITTIRNIDKSSAGKIFKNVIFK